ncbi:MAG: suppressor of fused domain protein [Planctomycetes bacterium]|nr:suppressor of fused domain protein [Planctomycetota bacterium]
MTSTTDPTASLGAPTWRRRCQDVDVAAYAPNAERRYATLVTCGREGGSGMEKELILCLPWEWTLEFDPTDRTWGWPLRLLVSLRSECREIGAVVPGSGGAEPFAQDSTLVAAMISEAIAPSELALDTSVRFAQVLALTEAERDFADLMGAEQMLALAISKGARLEILDPERASLVADGEFPDSSASRPGLIPVNEELLRELQPELYRGKQLTGRPAKILGTSLPPSEWIARLRTHAACGDLQPALVVRLDPLVIAVRTDELDCVALVGYPSKIGAMLRSRHRLQRGSRLSAVNTYFGEDGPKQNDLTQGPKARGAWHAFWPIVSETVSSDAVALARASRRIDDGDYAETERQAAEYVARKGWIVRNGTPLLSVIGGQPIAHLDAAPPETAAAARPQKRAARRERGSDDSGSGIPGWVLWLAVVLACGVLRACLAHH